MQSLFQEPKLIGRNTELEQLKTHLKSAKEGQGKSVFISGQAGSGKSRLVNEFINSNNKKEIILLKGWCVSNIAVPYFPFIEAFDKYYTETKTHKNTKSSLHRDSDELTIKEWLKGPTQQTLKENQLSPAVWKDLTFVAVTKALQAISKKRPAIFLIEDAHWADSASLSLFHYIARAIIDSKVLFLVTYRNDELNVDSEGHPHPLIEVLRLMDRENLSNKIELTKLNQDCVSEIAQQMLGGNLENQFSKKLSEESEGNPLFIVETLRMLTEHGNIIEQDSVFKLSVDVLGIPNKIKDVILRRLGVLKPTQRRVLDVASVIGETFDVDILAAVINQDKLEVLEALNTISTATSLILYRGNTYRFDHAKSQETLYEEIPPPLKREYHSKIAKEMESSKQDDLPVTHLAYHFAESGQIPKAIKYSIAAGTSALRSFSNNEAIKHFSTVLNMVGQVPSLLEDRALAKEGIADAYFAKGLFEEARKIYEALNLDETQPLLRLRALRKAVEASRWRGDLVHSINIANKAAPLQSIDRLEYARVIMNKGWACYLRGDAQEGLAEVEKALEVFDEEYVLADTACALTQAAAFGASSNRYPVEKSLRMGLRALAIYEDLQDFRGQVEAIHFLASVFMICGQFDQARKISNQAIKIGEKIADYNHLAWIYKYLATIEESAGNTERIDEILRKGLECAEKTDAYYIVHVILTELVIHLSRTNQLFEAKKVFDRMMESLPEIEHTGSKLAQASGKKAIAMYYAATGHLVLAEKASNESLDLALFLHHKQFESLVRQDKAWILSKQGKTQEAEEQRRLVQEIHNDLWKDFSHVNLQPDMMIKTVDQINEERTLRIDISNISTNSGKLLSLKNLIPLSFEVTKIPELSQYENGTLTFERKIVRPFSTERLILKLKPKATGQFILSPEIHFLSERQKEIVDKVKPITVMVNSSSNVLLNRVSTGTSELDTILLGGIPKGYSIVLTSPLSDELEQLIDRFLDIGNVDEGLTFFLTADAAEASRIARNIKPNLFLFICNSRADLIGTNQPNIFRLKGIENLTEIDISLVKVFRQLNKNIKGSKRACIGFLSDVLLQHHAVVTRKWLSALLAEFRSREFTTIAVIDPQIHPSNEAQAIMSLFDGEIRITEKETDKGPRKTLRINRLSKEKYLDHEVELKK